jgi:tetratricopeptide (TPR) repeat protein
MTIPQAFSAAAALHGQGRLDEAERVYLAILESNPDHFGSLHYLGGMRTRQGRPDEAIGLIGRAIAVKPDSAEAHNDLGIAFVALGQLDEAIAHYTRAVEIGPDLPDAHNNLGNVLLALGRPEQALVHLQRAVAIKPDAAEAHNNLGNALMALRRHDEAMERYRNALAIKPDLAEAYHNLGMALAAVGRMEDAIAQYQRALSFRSDYLDAHIKLANALEGLNRHEAAIVHFKKALALKPSSAELHNDLGNSFAVLHRYQEAVAHYNKAVALRPEFVEAHNNIGHAFAALGRHEDAVAHYQKALATNPEMGDVHHSLGNALRAIGRLAQSRAALERAVAVAPMRADFYRSLAEIKQFAAGDPHLAAMERLARDMDSLSDGHRIELHFALGKAYADLEQHERAFHHLLEGNALHRRHITYDEQGMLDLFRRIEAAFTADLIRDKGRKGESSQAPVFIVGMPRSGTTLVEQVLASHPKVFGAGELTAFTQSVASVVGPQSATVQFPESLASMTDDQLHQIGARYLAAIRAVAPDAERITDKMPANFRFAGLIHLALPGAKVIHVQRNPVDTCLSCFSKLFTGSQPYSYDLGELGRHFRAYESLMAHWRHVLPAGVMLEVQYEDLVADFGPQARRIVAHCGLEWDARCLAFHETQRPVHTASSAQVRQPIYHSAIGRSRPYEPWLGPLLEALGAASPEGSGGVARDGGKPAKG